MLRYCSLLLLLFCFTSSFAQVNSIFDHYTVDDGLAQSTINQMIQDKNGFLWIGTDGGLCRFDGYTFKTYKRNLKNKHAFNSDRGTHFYLDRSKRLWLISYNGVSLYRDKTDDFINLLTFEPKTAITTFNNFFGEDEQFIWAGLSDYGILKIDKKTLKLDKVVIPNANFKTEPTTWFRGFLENDKLWIANNADFVVYNTRTNTTQRPGYLMLDVVSENSNYSIGISNGEPIRIRKKDLKREALPIKKPALATIKAMYKLQNNQILFSADSLGAVFFDPKTNKVVQTITTVNENGVKKRMQFTNAYQDWSGNIWTQSNGEALRKLTYNAKAFNLYRNPLSRSNNIYSLATNAAFMYAGNLNHGMDIFSKKDGYVKTINYTKANSKLYDNGFISQSLNPDQLLILGYSLDKKSLPFTYTTSTGKVNLAPTAIQQFFTNYWPTGDFRKFVVKDGPATLLASVGSHLIAIKQINGQSRADTLKKFEGEMLSCCFRDKEGNLWIGTYKNQFVQRKGKWLKIALPKAMEIKTINQDLDGNMWLGNNDGIFILDKNDKIQAHYNENNQLKNEHIYGILRANDGNMWFSHNMGLTVYQWKTKTFRHYGVEDGLQSTEFNSGAYLKAEDGELYFGGINGTTSFYPEKLKDNLNVPAVKITQISLFDQPYQSTVSYWNIKSLELSYLQNSLGFDFTLPEFSNPGKNTYAYQMEGIDKNWVIANKRRFARYPALAPGHYTFKVKAANNDGIWSKPTRIKIYIVPPFWQRIWFIVLCCFTAAGLLSVVIITIQKQRFKRQMRAFEVKQKLQLERERISRDLHDNVGTQLSLISKNIEGVLHPFTDLTEQDRKQNLTTISLTSKEVIATLRETIWALSKEEITFEEFSDNLMDYTHKQIKNFSTLSLNFTEAEHASSIKLNATEAINLFRICQEAIANAIKYAEAKNLLVKLKIIENKYQITIKDDGQGFDRESLEVSSSYGLGNMEFRASEISCTFTLQTVPGQFTSIVINKI